MRYLILLLSFLCLLPKASGADGDKAPEGKPRLEWRFDCKVDERDLPSTRLEISIDGKIHLIQGKVPSGLHGVEAGEYKLHDVPAGAAIACAGWWAGSGDEFYAAREKDGVAVYYREVGEGLQPGRPYKKIKTIPYASH